MGLLLKELDKTVTKWEKHVLMGSFQYNKTS